MNCRGKFKGIARGRYAFEGLAAARERGADANGYEHRMMTHAGGY
jgi:hypothetical protein